MPLSKKDKQLALKLKELLKDKFGELISGIYCYGSRITDNKYESDFDIIIITSKKINWKIQRTIKGEIYNIGIDNDIVFDPKIFSEYEFNDKYRYLPFFKNVYKTGVYL